MFSLAGTAKKQPSELKETAVLLKDVGIHFVLEGRRQLANGLETLAEKVDIDKKQESFINEIHQKLNNRRAEKIAKKLNKEIKGVPVTA